MSPSWARRFGCGRCERRYHQRELIGIRRQCEVQWIAVDRGKRTPVMLHVLATREPAIRRTFFHGKYPSLFSSMVEARMARVRLLHLQSRIPHKGLNDANDLRPR